MAGCQPRATVSLYTAVPGSRPRETGTQTVSVDVPQSFSKGRRVEGLDSHVIASREDEPSPEVPPAPFILLKTPILLLMEMGSRNIDEIWPFYSEQTGVTHRNPSQQWVYHVGWYRWIRRRPSSQKPSREAKEQGARIAAVGPQLRTSDKKQIRDL